MNRIRKIKEIWKIKSRLTLVLLYLNLLGIPGLAQKVDSTSARPSVSFGEKGLQVLSADSNSLIQLEFRGQFRLGYPTDADPITLDDFESNRVYLRINRARMKVGGHAFRPNLKYYLEYELFATNLLDFRLMYEPFPFLKIKVGQWKAQYNRERIISSGKQQTMDRSILTRPFTIDRQQGVSIYGRLKGNGLLDFNYWVSAFMGTGRGATFNDDGRLMYMTRWQWNCTGSPLPFSGSDLSGAEKLIAVLAAGAVTNQSPFTRFSQAGGGQLIGFDEENPGQYRVNQWMQESAGYFRGFSWQQEFHWKEIKDLENKGIRTLFGNLIQGGYFFHRLLEWIPPQLELFGRYSFFNPFRDAGFLDQEISFGANFFINGHRNKLTMEYSYFKVNEAEVQLQDGSRVRLQWDVSF